MLSSGRTKGVLHPLAVVGFAAMVLLPLTLKNPVVGILVVALVAVAIATRTDFIRGGLFVIVALVPLESLGQMGQAGLLNLTVTKLLFPVALAALLLNHIWRNWPFVFNPALGWAFAFGLALLVSFLANERTPFAITSIRRYLSALAFFVFTLNALRGPRDVRNLIAVIIGSCAFSACAGLAGKLFGSMPMIARVVWTGSERLIGLSTVNPNTYAAQLSVAFWFCLCLLAWEKRLRNLVLLWGAILVFGLAIMLTYSRAVVVCLVLSGAYFALKHGMARRGARVLAAALLGALCLAPLVPEDYGDRLKSLATEEAQTDTSLRRRWSYHVIGLRLLADHPALGVGPGNFQREYMSETFRYETDTFQGWRLLHNLYLSIAAQAGLIALAAFLFLAGAALRSLWRLQRSPYAEHIRRLAVMLELGLISFLLNSVFLPHEYQKYLWLLLAVPPALEWTAAHAARLGEEEEEGTGLFLRARQTRSNRE